MDKYNVSERSIKYDINRLRSWLNDKKSHVNIAYIPKLGFELSGNSADIYNLQQIYNKETETTIVFSTERLRHIILTLLTEKKFITVNDLAKYLMVSKNTISRDIDTVQNMLEVWDIYIGVMVKSFASVDEAVRTVNEMQVMGIPVSVGLGGADPAMWLKVADTAIKTKPVHVNQVSLEQVIQLPHSELLVVNKLLLMPW
nr:KDGP aldolase [Pectinatus frisingensis]